jgi:hypothetical protein
MVLAMIALVAVGLLSAALLSAATAAYQTSAATRNRAQALLIAEGGAEKVYHRLKTDVSYRVDRPFSEQVGTATATGTIDRQGTTYVITSTATVGGASATVQLVVYTDVYQCGIYAGDFIWGQNNNIVRGADVVSGGPITGVAVDPGFFLLPYSPQVFPVFAPADYNTYPPPAVSGNTMTVTGTNYYAGTFGGLQIENDLVIRCPSGWGIIFIDGDLLAKNNLLLEGNLVLLVNGRMEAKNTATTTGETHIIVRRDVQIKNSMSLVGNMIVEGSFECKNNLSLVYQDSGWSLMPNEPMGSRWSVSWRR